MSLGCNCEAGLGNTGLPNCVPIQSVTSSLIIVPLTANDGTKNRIPLTLPLPVWADLVNESDESKRWFPTSQFENVELPKADSLFDEANSGRKVFLREGVRSFAGELWKDDSSPTMLGKLKKARCVEFGVYIVDVNGSLVGSEVDGYLYPIPVDNASWDPRYMFATDSTTSKIMVAFDFKRLFNESTMYMITAEEAGINFNELEGLIDVTLVVDTINATDVTVDAITDYGTALNKIKFKNADYTDFALVNLTTGLAVVITGGNEITPGGYTLNFAAQTTTDVMLLSVNKEGFIGSVQFIAV